MKKLFFTCFIAFALYFIIASPQAQAADYPVIQSGQKVSDTLLRENDRKMYQITVLKPSYLKLEATSYKSNFKISLLDSNQYQALSLDYIFENASETVPRKRSLSVYVEPGVYYISAVNSRENSPAKYYFTVTVTPTKVNEKEPNGTINGAQALRPNIDKISGILSWDDSFDYYKINITKNGIVTFKMDSTMLYYYFEIYDAETAQKKYIKYCNEVDFWSSSLELEKGSYYIKIISEGYTGKYNLQVKAPQMLPKSPKAKATKTKVTGTTYANSKVTAKIGSKKYTGKSNSKGAFSIKIPTQKVKTKVYVSVTTGAGTSKSTKVQVK